MSRSSEREIARRLAERDELEPPAGLLDKIKSEIPPSVHIGTGTPDERRSPMPFQQRWLIAASLVAMVGAGLFALRVREQAPPLARAAAPAPAGAPSRQAAVPQPAAPPVLERLGGEDREETLVQPLQAPPPVRIPEPAKPAAKDLKSPGPIRPKSESGAAGRAEAGGAVGNAPSPAPALQPAAAPRPQPEEKKEDKITVTAESPLLDERRVATGATVSQTELEKVPTARDPWAVLQKTPGVMTDRINVGGNESGQQSGYVGPGRSGDQAVWSIDGVVITDATALGSSPTYHDYDAFEEMQVTTSFVDTAANRLSTFVVALDTGSYAASRREVAAGRLPASGAVRVAEFVSAFGGAPVRQDVAIRAEGAPTPFVQGPRYRLLRFDLRGRAARLKDARVEVELNPEVVERHRLLGEEGRAAAGERGVTVLYEVELRADAPPKGRIATLRLRDPAGAEATLDLSGLAPTWEKASPEFRLTALAAELAEILKGSPLAKGDLAEIARQAREIARSLPKSAGAAELADLAERAARIRGAGRR